MEEGHLELHEGSETTNRNQGRSSRFRSRNRLEEESKEERRENKKRTD